MVCAGDTRESAAIYIARHLMDEGAHISIYDPKVNLALALQSRVQLVPNLVGFVSGKIEVWISSHMYFIWGFCLYFVILFSLDLWLWFYYKRHIFFFVSMKIKKDFLCTKYTRLDTIFNIHAHKKGDNFWLPNKEQLFRHTLKKYIYICWTLPLNYCV